MAGAGPVLRLDLALQMRRWMEVATHLTCAPALQEVHADRHVVLRIRRDVLRGMSVATLVRTARTDATLELTTDLEKQQDTDVSLIPLSTDPIVYGSYCLL